MLLEVFHDLDREDLRILREELGPSSELSASEQGLDRHRVRVGLLEDVLTELVQDSKAIRPQDAQLCFYTVTHSYDALIYLPVLLGDLRPVATLELCNRVHMLADLLGEV